MWMRTRRSLGLAADLLRIEPNKYTNAAATWPHTLLELNPTSACPMSEGSAHGETTPRYDRLAIEQWC